MRRFFRSGSFGFGTSVSNYSDVDYFAVVPPDRLNSNSAITLQTFHAVLARRFPLTNVRVDAPAIVVPFGSERSERHEIIPAWHISAPRGFDLFGIPNRTGGWMHSSPDASGAAIDWHNRRLNERAKGLIRLLKAWKYYNDVPIRSFYLELRATAYLASQFLILYRIDIEHALNRLYLTNLTDITDPTTGDSVAACEPHELMRAWTALNSATSLAAQANLQQQHGRNSEAFAAWDKFYNGHFPGYY
jgi:hypothetical protein